MINTHTESYSYTRLPFGVASALEGFQKVMEQLLYGIPVVVVNYNDILVFNLCTALAFTEKSF